jgi:putative glutamine amidotransferase
MRPIVLVTADRRAPAGFKPVPRVRPLRPEVFVGESYVAAVRRGGGSPRVAAPGDDAEDLLRGIDAVVLTGGDFDIHPSWYGAAVEARLDRVEPARTSTEIGLARACLARGIPILGVCGGMQALAVAAGGTLIQDLPKSPIDHEQPSDPAMPWHEVRIAAPADRWFGAKVAANSTHHQAVHDPGGLVACGWTDDGVIEVIATAEGFALGVQWHPELLGDDRPYQALIAAVRQPSR